mgnify:CR=1 FL=1
MKLVQGRPLKALIEECDSQRQRLALQRLIRDVQAGTADFTIILVYDVSRWGRFQDADESAYYEYICRRAGISGRGAR